MDRPWTSADAIQAEGRINRTTQMQPTTSIWLQNTVIDRKIDNLLLLKEKNINEILIGDRIGLDYESIDLRTQARDIIHEIFQM